MHRPVRPIDPNDAPEYEADLDAWEREQQSALDREFEQDDTNNETENDKDNERME